MIPTQMVTQNNKFANQCRGSNRLKDGRNRRMHVIMCASVYIPTNIAQNIPASKLCKVKLHLSLDVECRSHRMCKVLSRHTKLFITFSEVISGMWLLCVGKAGKMIPDKPSSQEDI